MSVVVAARLAMALVVALGIQGTAHADPARPSLWRALPNDTLERIGRPQPLGAAPGEHRSLDGDLAIVIDHAARYAGKLCGLSHGLSTFVHVENITGGNAHNNATPRLVVFGLQTFR